jgi:hypothetical protein
MKCKPAFGGRRSVQGRHAWVARNAVNRCYCFIAGVVCHLTTYDVCLPALRRSLRRLRVYSRS